MNKTRLVGLLFAATVLFQMPMIKLGSEKARPFTPITTVAAQLVLAVEDTSDAPGDPGDTVRVLLYPGEMLWVCTEDERSWLPRWDSFVKVKELKDIDKRISRVFGNKKPQIIAGSFFAVGGSWVASIRGNAGTLGIFSVVMIVWPLLSSTDVAPQFGLLVYVALAWQTMSISHAKAAAVAKRKKKRLRAAEAQKKKAEEDVADLMKKGGEVSEGATENEHKKDK